MSVETSQKILKIFGILGIIAGAAVIIFGLFGLLGGSMVGAGASTDEESAVAVVVLGASIAAVVEGIISLIEGVCSVRAAADSSKIMPAWIFAILGVISGVVGIIGDIASGIDIGSLVGGVLALCISVLIFRAANTIKQSR
ncbi:MAG: hypothetical protein IJT32_01540 [Lachnospiraceae bacterium]|nr:hypothetical protein [Lachnospiraceae bacterium]